MSNHNLPSILADHPPLAKALAAQQRALAAMNQAQEALRVAEAEADKIKPAAKFDEEAAAHRLAHARAHDTVHNTATAKKVELTLAAERDACAGACAKVTAAATAARAKADDAAIAFRGAESVWHDTNSAVFALLQERAAEVLPGLTEQTIAKAAELFELVDVARQVSLAKEGPSTSQPPAYVEASLAYPLPNEMRAGLAALSGRYGSSRSQAAIVFER